MKFQRLEAVRGFASFYVFAGHVLQSAGILGAYEFILRFGQEAVMVFFVLSGFVISWSTHKASTSGRVPEHYFAKRFIRIYSVWTLAVIAMFVIASLEAGQLTFQPVGRVIGNMLMLQDFYTAKPNVVCDALYNNTPLWSLHYEWWFYMLFPLVLAVRKPMSRVHTVGCIAVIASISYVVFPNPANRILMYFSIWWAGAHAATCKRTTGNTTLRDMTWPLLYISATALPLLFLCYLHYRRGESISFGMHPLLETRHLLSSVLLILLAFGWRNLNWVGFHQLFGMFSYLAPISFSLYVIHLKSIAFASYLSFLQNPVLEWVLYLVITLAFCCVAELIVYPYLRLQFGRFTQK